MNKRPIYIFTHTFPNTGGEPYLQDEIGAIASLGYSITFCPYGVEIKEENILNKGFIQQSGDSWRAIRYLLGDLFVAPLGLTIIKFRYLVALVKERIAAARYYAQHIAQNAVVYTYWFDELGVLGHEIKKLRKDIKWISRAHGFDVYEEQSEDNFLFFKQNKLAAIDALYMVSQNGADYLQNQHPRYGNKIKQAYLGCKSLGFSEVQNNSVWHITTCAYLRSIKRVDSILDALQGFLDPLVFHIIGDGPDLEKLKTIAAQLPAHITCVFYGNCSKNQIAEIYAKGMHCFVNASSSEGLPVSIMEAISTGMPVVATAVGGTPEIVNSITGQLVDVNFTQQELLTAITQVCQKGADNAYRKEVFNYWNKNFNAEINYQNFYKEISA